MAGLKKRRKKQMKKYLVFSINNRTNEEFLEHETDDRKEAIKEANREFDREHDPDFSIELRSVEEIADDGINYNYNTLEFRIFDRANLYNMREICERAGVNYSTWRRFKSGLQNMSDKKIEALNKAMDEA